MKHVGYFLENNALITANTVESLKYDVITDSFAGKLVSYLTYYAYLHMSLETNLSSPSTVVSYLSAWDNVIINKFYNRVQIPIFGKDYWWKCLDSIAKIK